MDSSTLAVEGGIFQPYDFLTSESLGTDLPCRCTSCRKCKECKFRTDSLTFKEDQEYQVILEGLEFNKRRGRWRATYPFHIPPTTLKDNYQQVFKYTLAQEKRLAKQGRTEEFNAEFYKTVERGVFKEITKEEMDAWDGGDRRVILHGVLPDGREEIYGTARGAEEIPVRPGNSVGGSFQAAGHLGLDSGP